MAFVALTETLANGSRLCSRHSVDIISFYGIHPNDIRPSIRLFDRIFFKFNNNKPWTQL